MCSAMVLLSLLPQLHLWLVRGRDWNGGYVSPQGDELLYSAYINALIDGRTRKNDPLAAGIIRRAHLCLNPFFQFSLCLPI
jgi:hypothetical protein